MVSTEYVNFFKTMYRSGKLLLDGVTVDQQKALRGKASIYLSRTKQHMIEDMEALTTLASLLPEKHLVEVFTQERIDKLMSALLTVHTVNLRPSIKNGKWIDPKRLIKESGKDLEALIETQYQIASMIMEKGAAKCLEALEQEIRYADSPLYKLVVREARTAVSLLNYVATGRVGINLDYHFSSEAYKPEAVAARHERMRDRRNRL
jgi:hypothetical protein